MSNTPEIFIGLTSSNSQLFLEHCLQSLIDTTQNIQKRIVVLDNASTDNSINIARRLGIDVIIRVSSQADALNILFSLSKSPITLLIHSDIIFLSDRWFELCKNNLNNGIALISPEDIGCGPYTRPFGIGKPESSFLFFDTEKMKKTKIIRWKRKFHILIPSRVIDFYGNHITHNLPFHLQKVGLGWFPMSVHISDNVAQPIYQPDFIPRTWSEELAYLRYGLGNFYNIDGVITHYHNWYERLNLNVDRNSQLSAHKNGTGFPVAYIKAYTEAFLRDYIAKKLVLPRATQIKRKPVAL
jgi:glycosyltransferase involved in cell wall biosynthesis